MSHSMSILISLSQYLAYILLNNNTSNILKINFCYNTCTLYITDMNKLIYCGWNPQFPWMKKQSMKPIRGMALLHVSPRSLDHYCTLDLPMHFLHVNHFVYVICLRCDYESINYVYIEINRVLMQIFSLNSSVSSL